MSAVYPVNEQVSLEDPCLPKFAYQINRGSTPVMVRNISNPLPCGNCYWNVDAVVERNGGSMLLGWDVTLWPGSHLSAVHHAIYKAPNDELYDVTEKLPGNSNIQHSIFIPDNKISIQLDRLPTIGIQFFVINQNEFTNRYIEAYRNLNFIEKENSKTLYNCGFRCETNKAIARGRPPHPTAFTEDEVNKINELAYRIQKAQFVLGDAMKELKNFTTAHR